MYRVYEIRYIRFAISRDVFANSTHMRAERARRPPLVYFRDWCSLFLSLSLSPSLRRAGPRFNVVRSSQQQCVTAKNPPLSFLFFLSPSLSLSLSPSLRFPGVRPPSYSARS